MNKPVHVLTVAMLLLSTFGYGQSPTDLPRVLQPAPNAAILGKFGDVPISQYSGAASISVPLYTIQSGDITVPISLDYHTGGIRLKEYAGWTGLGWALSGAGNVINRQLKDKDDIVRLGTYYGGMELITRGRTQKPLNALSGNINFPTGITTTIPGELFDFSNILDNLQAYDNEYDVFSYNFLGKSGKFILTRSGQPVLEKADDIVITLDENDNFQITDEKGFIYTFSSKEQASLNPSFGTYLTSWYLSKIKSVRGDSVMFTYKTTTVPQLEQVLETINLGCGIDGSTPLVVSTQFQQTLILDRIDFQGGYVEFLTDNLREDYNGLRITGIKVHSDYSDDLIKEYEFSYSYFDDLNRIRLRLDKVTEQSNGASLPSYQFHYVNTVPGGGSSTQSLNSNSIDTWGYYNARPNLETLVSRFTGGPLRIYQKLDANINLAILDYDFIDLPGADRDPNPATMSLFSLDEITYPTSGKTVIQTEPNTYEHTVLQSNSEPQPKLVKKTYVIMFENSGDYSGDLSFITHKAKSQIKVNVGFICSDYQGGCDEIYNNHPEVNYGKIRFSLSTNQAADFKGYVIRGGPGRHAELSVEPDDNLNDNVPLNLSYTAHIDNIIDYVNTQVNDDFQRISARFEWYEEEFQPQQNTGFVKTGGGLRVKSISDYDANGKLIKSRTYDYEYKKDTNGDGIMETHSYGKIMSLPYYYRYYVLSNDQGLACPSFQRFANSITSSGQSVGYDQVTETITDLEGNDNGKSIYKFINKPDSINHYEYNEVLFMESFIFNGRPPGLPNVTYPINGSLLSKTEYKKDGSNYKPVHKVSNEYVSKLLNNYYSFFTELVEEPGPPIYLLYIYPSIRSQRILLTKTREVSYNGYDSLVNETLYEYGENHQQATKVTSTDSKGKTMIQNMIYPQDFGPLSSSTDGIKDLQEKNIVIPVEQYSVLQDNETSVQYLTGGVYTTFKETEPFPDKVHVFETKEPLLLSTFHPSNETPGTVSKDARYVPRLLYNQYDDKGNIQWVSKSDDADIVYIWGYNQAYPVAEVKNATLDKIAYTSFETSEGKGNWNYNGTEESVNPAKTGNSYYSLTPSTQVSKSLPAGTYLLEYYATGSVTITGAATNQSWSVPPDANGWTYNRKLITLSATGTLQLSGTTALDELRVYPADAQMVSYTYDPHIGISSITDGNGETVYYKYDDFKRLKFIVNDDGHIVKKYAYHYKNEN